MAKENRDLRLASAEKMAAALPAKLTTAVIVFFLPVLFIVVLGPSIVRVQDVMRTKAKRLPAAGRRRPRRTGWASPDFIDAQVRVERLPPSIWPSRPR